MDWIDLSGLNWQNVPNWTEVERMDWNWPNWTKFTEVDRTGQNWWSRLRIRLGTAYLVETVLKYACNLIFFLKIWENKGKSEVLKNYI